MKTLTEQDYKNAAKELRCEIAAIKAVAEVESLDGGFQSDGKPKILFERHKFHEFTGGKYSAEYPDISNLRAGGYTKNEHARLEKAAKLNRTEALKSASWGKFQIMGFNYSIVGFSTLQDFINAMYRSESDQLNAFVQFIKSNKLDDELREKRWSDFARIYNGKNFHINQYDVKMAKAYKKYSNRV
ncbi:N-acetylmuramidase family protein [Chryseobacterium aquaticum]|uniref:Peptidoglycan-binding protein n=1 Tax=Chryseobacterium aquaticum subsp. greenlandense TaxID=345663 RepID=A0A117KBS1_9FLAO|nr:N-acetylmuramidase family protein [Chryseobacterium aquaticum]KUJ56459.1 peptidoglycan-binding protein [Chryseobacterium aquaticum subsp. greenlandense]